MKKEVFFPDCLFNFTFLKMESNGSVFLIWFLLFVLNLLEILHSLQGQENS